MGLLDLSRLSCAAVMQVTQECVRKALRGVFGFLCPCACHARFYIACMPAVNEDPAAAVESASASRSSFNVSFLANCVQGTTGPSSV